MAPTADDVRALARSAHARWESLHLIHRDHLGEDVEAWLRHGELDAVHRATGIRVRDRRPPRSSWTVRPLEPYVDSYRWSAMLDPHELGEGVELAGIRVEELHGRPVWRFEARAVNGYDPICSCCPLVMSEAAARLEAGDGWEPVPGTLPEAVEIALDGETGIVVSMREVGGNRGEWFENEILEAAGPTPPDGS